MTIPPLIVYGTTIIRMGHFHYWHEAFPLLAWGISISRVKHFG